MEKERYKRNLRKVSQVTEWIFVECPSRNSGMGENMKMHDCIYDKLVLGRGHSTLILDKG